MATDKEFLTVRLREACVGHPAAEIKWPHRLLHEAADEIERMRAEVERLKAGLIGRLGLRPTVEGKSIYEWIAAHNREQQAREAAEARLRELREALTTIKEIVSDKFLHKHEKLEVIESRCDISLCNEALAKSHG